MIPLSKIDSVVAFLGLLLFVGGLKATMTSFDPTAGGAASAGNIRLQLSGGLVYLMTAFLILVRLEKFLSFGQRNFAMIVFLAVPLLSVVWSIAPDVTARRAIALAGTSLFGMYLAFALPVERVIRILAVVYSITAIVSLIVIIILPTYGTHQFGNYAGLWRGLYAQKNEFGATMAMAAIVIFLCPKHTSKERLLGRIMVVLCVLLMVMSESRAAWVSFASVCLVGLAIKSVSGQGATTSVKVGLTIAASVVVIVLLIKNLVPLLEMIGKDPTLSGRTDIWVLALDRAAERPILGYGYRAYWIDENKDRLQLIEGWFDYINHGHNTYLDLYVELGYLGCLGFLIVMLAFFIKITRRIKYSNDYINLWAVSSMFFILIRGTAESTILQHADINWVLFVYFFALFQGYRRQSDQTIRQSSPLFVNESRLLRQS
jgi:O-antigen ligase